MIDAMLSIGQHWPFRAYSRNPDDTVYDILKLANETKAFGAIIKMNKEDLINFTFHVFSTDEKGKH